MRYLIAIIAVLAVPAIASSKTIHVPGDCTKIQEAIDAAVDGDTVLVAPGSYLESINLNGKKVMVKSSGGAVVTVIDGNHTWIAARSLLHPHGKR